MLQKYSNYSGHTWRHDSPVIYDNKNPGATLIQSALIFGIAHATPAVLSFLLITVSAFFLSPNELGIIGLVEAVAIVVANIALLGLPIALSRLFFSENCERQRMLLVSSILRGGMFVAAVFGLASMILGPKIVGMFPTDLPEFYPYFAYAIGYQLLYQLFEYRLTIYQVNKQSTPYAVLHIVTGLTVFSFVIFFMVVKNEGASGFLLGRFLAVSITFLFVLYGLRNYLFFGWNSEKFKSALKFSVPLIPHTIAMIVLNFADRLMLQIYSTTTEVGLYTLAYTLGLSMYLVTIAFNTAWAPYFFQAVNDGKERYLEIFDLSGKAVALSTSIAIFGVTISRDFVTSIFSEEYHATATIVPLIIAGYLLFFLYSMFSYSILHKKETKIIAPFTAITAATNIALNSLLIPEFGMTGAAWATIISFGFMALIAYVIAVSVLPIKYPTGKTLLSLGLFAPVLIISQYDEVDSYVIYLVGIVAVLTVLMASFKRARCSAVAR